MNSNEAVKKTYKQCLRFINVANQFRGKALKKGDDTPIVSTQADYAIDRTVAKVKTAIRENGCEERTQEAIADAWIDYASVDEKGNLITEKESYSYTKDNRKKVDEVIRAAQKKKEETEISFVPHMIKTIPTLTYEQIEVFRGFVIPEDYELPEPE